VNARFPGARHDAYIWSTSAARAVMERAYHRGERRTYSHWYDFLGII